VLVVALIALWALLSQAVAQHAGDVAACRAKRAELRVPDLQCPGDPGYGELHLTPAERAATNDCRRLYPNKARAPATCLVLDNKLRDAHEQGIYGRNCYEWRGRWIRSDTDD